MATILPNGWRKHFSDGTFYTALDQEVEQRTKSWRNSRQEGIVRVDITHKKLGTAVIRGTGEFWQEDDLVASLNFSGSIKGRIVARRIMKKIHAEDTFVRISRESNSITCAFSPYHSNDLLSRPISPEDIGKWFVVELDLINKKFHWYLKE